MAGPACHSEDGNQAVFIGTNLLTGDAAALCQDCLPSFLVALLATMTHTDASALSEWIYGHEGEATAAEGAPTDEAPAPAPADQDDDQAAGEDAGGEAASWVENGSPPPAAGKGSGRTRSASPSVAADTGGEKADDGE